MRFRRIRSLLSAFSNGELSGRKHETVRQAMLEDDTLRREDALYQTIGKTAKELPEKTVSDDFNARLLDRIAHERFAETRSKAYLPKAAPSPLFRRLVPVAAVAAVATFAFINSFVMNGEQAGGDMAADDSSSDKYMWVQPDHNPYMAGMMASNAKVP